MSVDGGSGLCLIILPHCFPIKAGLIPRPCIYLELFSAAILAPPLHSTSYKRRCEFCLGLSLIFSDIFPSPVPYSSLIFQVNLDRRHTQNGISCLQAFQMSSKRPAYGGKGLMVYKLGLLSLFYKVSNHLNCL